MRKEFKFTEESVLSLKNYIKKDCDFNDAMYEIGMNREDFIDEIYGDDGFMASVIYSYESGEYIPLDKKYLDVSWYSMRDADGNEILLDMDAMYEEFKECMREIYA